MIEIEKNIPMPTEKKKMPALKYPWKEMEIGDSIGIENTTRQNTYTLAYKANKTYAPKIFKGVTRGGITRIWRIA